MPASVAATSLSFMKSSTNSSLSAVNVRMVSSMRDREPGSERARRGRHEGLGTTHSIGFSRDRLDPRTGASGSRTGPGPAVGAGGNAERAPRRNAGPARQETRSHSDLRDVRRLLALGARDEVELHPFPFGERAEAARADRREVHEHVLTRVRGDEAEAL